MLMKFFISMFFRMIVDECNWPFLYFHQYLLNLFLVISILMVESDANSDHTFAVSCCNVILIC